MCGRTHYFGASCTTLVLELHTVAYCESRNFVGAKHPTQFRFGDKRTSPYLVLSRGMVESCLG